MNWRDDRPTRAGSPYSKQKGNSHGFDSHRSMREYDPTTCDHENTGRVYEQREFPRCDSCNRAVFPYRMAT